ncbi:hypothetical protein DRH14_03075 [Candidatus Shapirobacteria bacterium]|nr:MAG: hypothetical protein DRH14_03075 [Candidatus Shapirobacteria bacterium]
MAKLPAFQFYPGDWRKDTQVQMASMQTRGVWFEMLCCMWDAPERGVLEGKKEDLCRLLGCERAVFDEAILDISRLKIADVQNGQDFVKIVNRRMYKEEKLREYNRLAKRRQRMKEVSQGKSQKNVNLYSSSSSSSSKRKEIKEKKKEKVNSPSSKKKSMKEKEELPFWLNEKIWEDFRAHRVALKKKMTPQAEKMLIRKLDRLRQSGNDPTQVLEESIANGWQGVFELNPLKTGGKKNVSEWEREAERIDAEYRRRKAAKEAAIDNTSEITSANPGRAP